MTHKEKCAHKAGQDIVISLSIWVFGIIYILLCTTYSVALMFQMPFQPAGVCHEVKKSVAVSDYKIILPWPSPSQNSHIFNMMANLREAIIFISYRNFPNSLWL